MKKLCVLLCSGFLLSANAQTLDDVELFNTRGLHGTPRYVSMGGAYTALGNDLSAIHLNPAAASVYRSDNFGLSIGLQTTQGNQNFFGGNSYQSNVNLLFENIGLVKKFEVGSYGNETQLAFSISYNKLASFDRNYSVTGSHPVGGLGEGSLADYWFQNAYYGGDFEGLKFPDELSDFGLFEEYAASQAEILISTDTTGLINDIAFGNGSPAETDLQYMRDQSGSLNEASLSFGGQYQDDFFYGISLGFPTLSYRNEDFVTEFNLPTDTFPFDATSYTLRRVNELYGAGINIKLGVIYKPAQWIRIGAAYESPSWYSISQIYEFDVTSSFANGDQAQSDIFSTGEYSYSLRTPSVYRIGTALIFGRNGLISIDYEYTNPSASKVYLGNGSYNTPESEVQNANDDISFFMRNKNTLKAGGEYRIGLFAFRAGYAFQQSFYQDPEEFVSDRHTMSLGIGFQTQSFGIDLGYARSAYTRQDFVHPFATTSSSGSITDELVNSDIVRSNILLGATFRF